MILLISLMLDVGLTLTAMAKRKGKMPLCRFITMSMLVNMSAFYLREGLAAEFGTVVFLEAACAAAAKLFVVWIFIQKEEPAEGILPVYLLCDAVSLCIHSNPASGLFCQLTLMIFVLYSEFKDRERQWREAEEGTESTKSTHAGRNLYLQTIEESYRKNRALMHDLNNHAIAMRALAANGEYGELVQYIDTFSRKVKDSMFPVHSGNIVLDALLADKFHRASRLDIPVVFEGIRYRADFGNEDLCTVVGNLLDNAIEENEKCRDAAQRRISISISSDEDSLRVTVKNPLFHELKVKNGLPASEKPDAEHHGMGLKNVRRICDKYGGTLVWDVSETEFCVTADLFLAV